MKNKTRVYKSYEHFLKRKDKTVNGISPDFAERHPNYVEDNLTNKGCWNCSSCRYCSDCRSCSYCSDCRYCSSCRYCSDCSYCSYCSDCSSCHDCSDCSDCNSCNSNDDVPENKKISKIPVVENIHTKIKEATDVEGALKMETWHTSCGTSHCRAGWAVHLAGEEGYELEKQTDTAFAAMQIFKASSDIKVPLHMFYTNNKESKADIDRCAKEEVNN